ncbi:MAG: nitrogen fixation protein NifQ [Candidatus Thiodiazotropha sp.]
MSRSALAIETPQVIYARLMAARRGDPIEETLARMLASWSVGLGSMPDWLGLREADYQWMMHYHFPGHASTQLVNPGRPLEIERSDEMVNVHKLLMENRTSGSQSETWMAGILVAGCLGDDHLWQDLGLWNRVELSHLMLENFKPLAMRNVKDMKWKKFLYKQLCETEGIYTCRAPSCEACADYSNCFGSEE